MKIVRFLSLEGVAQYGWMVEDKIGPIQGNPFFDYHRQEPQIPVSQVKLLAPVQPGKIIAVGRNYIDHAHEHGVEVPEIPLIFLKPPSSIIGPMDEIVLPPQSRQVEHEAELVVVVGKRGRWIDLNQAREYIYGYTVGNDITARDLQRKDGQWTRGKGFDTFCPLGPWIETDIEPSDLQITCRVNDELRQMSSTREMVYSVAQLLVFVSSIMTVDPGDVIMTGTPAGVGLLAAGDRLVTTIEGIGELTNTVRTDKNHGANK
jgi:2-keto-4-pentenoate hydratase/2-oxohepta-3-ene-1,7-dioic acid hydratase in catechol pathway